MHRIGRTARAGSEGVAYSFCAAEEREDHRAIEKLTGVKMNIRKHANHSNTAQFAEGAAAKPAPRAQGKGRSGGSSKPGSRDGPSGGSGKPSSKGTYRKSHSKGGQSGSSSSKKGNQRTRK